MLLGTRRSLHAKALAVIDPGLATGSTSTSTGWPIMHSWRGFGKRPCRTSFVAAGEPFGAAPTRMRSGLPSGAGDPCRIGRIRPRKTRAEIDFRLIVIIALEPLGKHRQIADVLREAAELDDPLERSNTQCGRQLSVRARSVENWGARQRNGGGQGCIRHSAADRRARPVVCISAPDWDRAPRNRLLTESRSRYTKSASRVRSPELDAKRRGGPPTPSVVLRTFRPIPWSKSAK